jgi:hypothetical protein
VLGGIEEHLATSIRDGTVSDHAVVVRKASLGIEIFGCQGIEQERLKGNIWSLFW